MTDVQQALDVAVGAFVDELAAAGVRHVCICPGSRSTPLAIKLAQSDLLKVWLHLDERSAAFFGLGLARALDAPVALLATSGTAAANFFPAVVEANLARVPLVVLTADRPHELRDVGAPQTIDQLRLYGGHAKWFFDLPEPELSPEHVRLVRTLAARAVATARAEPAGPVHLNWPFREPLVPLPGPCEERAFGGLERQPAVRVGIGKLAPSADLVAALARDLAAQQRGIIVCGPQDDPRLAEAVAALANATGYPILADALSRVRCGPHDRSHVVDTFDAFLRDERTAARLRPEVVVRLGAPPTSKPLMQYLERCADARQVVVDSGGWREPSGLATDLLHVDSTLLCAALADALPEASDPNWWQTWSQINAAARRAMNDHLDCAAELSETGVVGELQALLPAAAMVYAGNSMPVRDLDTFLRADDRSLRCLANRGANGIDGVVSSALGASAAGLEPVVLVIGDVSFYHDLNGLLAARKYDLDLLVVLVNNDGGGIFSFLSQAENTAIGEHFELLFGTPHGLDFRPFVEAYGGRFDRPRDWPEFRAALADALPARGLRVVEVSTDRTRNVTQHRAVWRAVSEALAPAPVA